MKNIGCMGFFEDIGAVSAVESGGGISIPVVQYHRQRMAKSIDSRPVVTEKGITFEDDPELERPAA